jgi:WD40 repeat protein
MRTRTFTAAAALAWAFAASVGSEQAAFVETDSHRDHDGSVYFLRWSPDGSRVASAGGDGAVVVRALAGGEPIRLRGHKAEAWGLSWSPDGSKIVSVALERGARIWDLGSGREEALLEWPGSGAYSVAWSPDGRTIAVGAATGMIYSYDYPSGKPLAQWQAHLGELSSAIICLAWSPDGGRLASGSIDFTAKIWDLRSVRAEGAAVSAGAAQSTGAAAGIASDAAPLVTLKAATSARNDINGIAWSPDGTRLATAGQDGRVRVWDLETGTQVRALFHGGWVRGVAWSPDGKLIAASGNSRTITLWDAASGESRGSLGGHASPVWALQWSPDGSILASGSGLYGSKGGDCSLRFWR